MIVELFTPFKIRILPGGGVHAASERATETLSTPTASATANAASAAYVRALPSDPKMETGKEEPVCAALVAAGRPRLLSRKRSPIGLLFSYTMPWCVA